MNMRLMAAVLIVGFITGWITCDWWTWRQMKPLEDSVHYWPDKS